MYDDNSDNEDYELDELENIDNLNNDNCVSDNIINIIKNKINYKIRIIKYNIFGNPYSIITNKYNSSISEIKELYKKRWTIEVGFRDLKYNLSLHILKSHKLSSVEKNISIHKFILLLSSYFRNEVRKEIKGDENINVKISIDKTINILYNLLYKNLTKSNLKYVSEIVIDMIKHIIIYKKRIDILKE